MPIGIFMQMILCYKYIGSHVSTYNFCTLQSVMWFKNKIKQYIFVDDLNISYLASQKLLKSQLHISIWHHA